MSSSTPLPPHSVKYYSERQDSVHPFLIRALGGRRVVGKKPILVELIFATQIQGENWAEEKTTLNIDVRDSILKALQGIRPDVQLFDWRSNGGGRGSLKYFARCAMCGEITDEFDHLDDDTYICLPCRRKMVRCFDCRSWVLKDKAHSTTPSGRSEHSYCCPDCFPHVTVCSTCKAFKYKSEMVGGKCWGCFSSTVPENIVPQEGTSLTGRGSREDTDYIHDYSHKPSPNFHFSSSDKPPRLFMGVELETDRYVQDRRAQAAKELHKLDPHEYLFYMKQDSSLNFGVEVVSHPTTLQFHRDSFPWKEIRNAVIRNKGRSHETRTCGMHIHFNKDFLGAEDSPECDLVELRLLHIFERFWSKILVFSRRKPLDATHYAKKDSAGIQETDKDKLRNIKDSQGRNRAINLTNSTTIEFRVFKGSLNVNTILATLGFVDFLVRFCKDLPTKKLHDMSWEDLVSNIPEQKYPELLDYLRRKSLCV